MLSEVEGIWRASYCNPQNEAATSLQSARLEKGLLDEGALAAPDKEG